MCEDNPWCGRSLHKYCSTKVFLLTNQPTTNPKTENFPDYAKKLAEYLFFLISTAFLV